MIEPIYRVDRLKILTFDRVIRTEPDQVSYVFESLRVSFDHQCQLKEGQNHFTSTFISTS